ncbi:MAG: NUDIX hydrolase [Nocardioidaceae bacterium]|nr:NUDIX hydrolase [Nocardioidaceae bacterium]
METLDCTCGRQHDGAHGAAGLALIRDGRLLICHHSEFAMANGVWSLPGGPVEHGESPLRAAKRAARTELAGLDVSAIRVVGEMVDDHGGWAYTTLICEYDGPTELKPSGPDASGLVWAPLEAVSSAQMLDQSAHTWPALRDRIKQLLDLSPVLPSEVAEIARWLRAVSADPLVPEVDQNPTETTVGWRVWRPTNLGGLEAPSQDPWVPWPAEGYRARCQYPRWALEAGSTVHESPHPDCLCGIRVVPTIEELLSIQPVNLGAGAINDWSNISYDYMRHREEWGLWETLDVVGTVECWGTMVPTRETEAEPESVLTAQYARVGPRVHLSGHAWQAAEAMADTYNTEVVVGSTLGPSWYREIIGYEKNHPLPETRAAKVTPLGPLGSVNSPVSLRRKFFDFSALADGIHGR